MKIRNGECPGASNLIFPDETVDDEQHDGTRGGDEDPAQIERFDFSESHEGSEKAANDRADNPDQDCDEDSARVFARHDELGKRARDKSKKDPRDDSHSSNR